MCTAELDLSYNKRFPDAYVPEAYEKLIHVRYVTALLLLLLLLLLRYAVGHSQPPCHARHADDYDDTDSLDFTCALDRRN
jgi:hypothetical protein